MIEKFSWRIFDLTRRPTFIKKCSWIFWVLRYILYFLNLFPIFVGSVHNFGKSEDDIMNILVVPMSRIISSLCIKIDYFFAYTVFPRIIVATTILFLRFRCDNYSRETTIQRRKLLISFFLGGIHNLNCCHTMYVKVRKFQKIFFFKLHCSKNEANFRQNSALWS